VGYQPIVQTTNIGALLEIRPTLVSGGSVMVDLKSTVTAEGDAEGGVELNAAGVGIAPVVDRVAIETLEFAGTLRMPLKKPVLVGGLTYSPSARGEDKAELTGGEIAAVERPQLYLVLEVK
jgi:hypothetical protein